MKKEDRYTMHGIYIFETFDNLCNRFRLRPSRWLPRLPKPEGVYRKMYVYSRDPETGESTKREEFSDFWWSGWDFLFHLVQDEEKHPVLYQVVGQLYETAAGVYDWIDFSKMKPVDAATRISTLEFPIRPGEEDRTD
jgi:hypothetical protein